MPGRHDFSEHHTKTLDDYYLGIRGTRLRHAALAVLLKGRHRLDPSVTKKSVADALRYECAKGRAIRIEGEEREILPQLTTEEYEMHLLGEEERRLVEQLRAQRLLAAHEGDAAPLPDAVDIL
jgi:hypothetical protein